MHQVEHALRLGYLKPGDQLPKVRDVVAELAINPNTVLKAYKELETKGLAAGRPGQGTFIEATLSQVALPELIGLHGPCSAGWPRPRRRDLTRTGWWRCLPARCGISITAAAAPQPVPARRARNGGRRMNVIETSGLGKRYGSTWALRECTLAVPAGHVAALVGPNGAGKSTLLNLAVGLAEPTAGGVTVLGGLSAGSHAALDGIAFVAQDTPLYKNLSAADMLHLTRNLNRRFDQDYAEARLGELGIPLKRKAGKLSGGQQAQLALSLALAVGRGCCVLDEPVAMLDPIARHDFMAIVLTAAADDGVSVVLSSHVLAELERVADYLILLSRGRVQVAGEVDDLLASHRMLTGPAAEADKYAERPVVHARRGRGPGPPAGPGRRRRSGTAGLGGAPGRPGRARDGLPARARRRGAARPGPRPGHPAIGGDEMTALTMPARPGARRPPAASAVAADGLGHLATAPGRADRRGRVPRRVRAVPVAHRPSDPPRLRRRDLPPGKLNRLHHKLHRQIRHDCDCRQHLSAGGACADRGVRRGAGAGSGD